MSKAALPLLVAAAGIGAAVAFFASKKPPGNIVTAQSGKSWRVVMVGTNGATHTYEVFAPASSFGPHAELSVLRYSQTGSDVTSRAIVAVGSGVPVAIVQTAATDFGLPFNPALMPS